VVTNPATATLEIINLDDSSEGAAGSPTQNVEQPQVSPAPASAAMMTQTQLASSGQALRGPGSAVRLDHLSVTYPGVQSNWHVNWQAKDLNCVYPYDAEMMAKVGEVGCLEVGSVMMARCLAIMQYHRRAAEERINLRDRVEDLEQKGDHLTEEKVKLSQEVHGLRQTVSDRHSMLAEKEMQLLHFKGLCECREAELTQCRDKLIRLEQGIKNAEVRVTELHASVARLETEMTKKEATWDSEKAQLEKPASRYMRMVFSRP